MWLQQTARAGVHFRGLHGFIRSPEGVISSFEVPRADSTTAVAINNFNVVTGWSDSETNPGAFIRIPDVL
jgi:hypothetical protein